MSLHRLRRTTNPYDTLEAILNKTGLTTQRIAHSHIIGIGSDVLARIEADIAECKSAAIKTAIHEAKEEQKRILQFTLKRTLTEAKQEKVKAIKVQKEFYVNLSEQVAQRRDEAEQEHKRELTRKFESQLKDALQAQAEENQRLMDATVQKTIAATTKRLQKEFQLEKEATIKRILIKAEKEYKRREEEMILATKLKYEEVAALEISKVNSQHAEEVNGFNIRISELREKYDNELEFRLTVQQDFRDLQEDYARFMDYTGGKFHSSFMMKFRHGREKSSVHYSPREHLSPRENLTPRDHLTPIMRLFP